MKKTLSLILVAAMLLFALVGCSSTDEGNNDANNENENTENNETNNETPETPDNSEEPEAAGMTGDITVCTREDGSGTRSAFIELMGIETDEDGDRTINTAETTNSTGVMMTTVAGNVQAIGYISLGSLDDSVKAVSVNGVEPTVENILAGDYVVSRPFNIATLEEVSDTTQDFINYILSTEGQAIIEEEGYIPLQETTPYENNSVAGDITVGGSSSVSPVMELLIEAYNEINPDVNITLQTQDSSTGMSNAASGVYDIGMASREVKDEEIAQGLVPTTIATDGIAVVVNNDNPTSDLTAEQICSIYIGEITTWDELN